MMRTLRLAAMLLASVTLLAVGFACTGGAKDGYGSPTPTPSPTPVDVDHCQIVWVNDLPKGGTEEDHFDVFLVDAPLEAWTTGTKTYNVNSPIGVFYHDAVTEAGPAEAAAVTTSGEFGLVLADGTTTGGVVRFDDGTPQTFYALNQTNGQVGAMVGTGGAGTFEGVWSDPDSTTVVGGEGLVGMAYQGTSFQIGIAGSFAVCYDRQSVSGFDARTARSFRRIGDLIDGR